MSNRRFRRMQERMMAKPKFVDALRRFNDLPTNEDMQQYLQRKVQYEMTQPTKVMPPINVSEDMIEDYTELAKKRFEDGYDNTINEYYNIK